MHAVYEIPQELLSAQDVRGDIADAAEMGFLAGLEVSLQL
jgi:hypothetical protein